jgi:hypothetical protein
MHKRHDQLSKRIAREILDLLCSTQLEVEVPSLDALHMDLWAEPRLPLPPDLPGYLVLLAKMVSRPGHLELWSSIPDDDDLHQTQRKKLCYHHHRRLVARREGRPLPPLFPTWTMTPGEPSAYFARARVRAAAGWPPGFYWTDEHSEMWTVVLNQLEPTRETLFLRLLCPGPARKQARKEIRNLPEDDPDRSRLLELDDLLQRAVSRDKNVPESERSEFMTEARAEQLRFIEETKQQGRQDGEKKGIAGILLDVYEQRLGTPPESVRGALFAMEDAARLRALLPLFLSGAADDIARALLS